jgi:hypothetical protein
MRSQIGTKARSALAPDSGSHYYLVRLSGKRTGSSSTNPISFFSRHEQMNEFYKHQNIPYASSDFSCSLAYLIEITRGHRGGFFNLQCV